MGLKVKAKSEMVAQLRCLITSNSWANYEIGQMSLFPETLWTREACSCCAVPAPVTQTHTGPVLCCCGGDWRQYAAFCCESSCFPAHVKQQGGVAGGGAMSVIMGRRVAEYHPPARVPRCSCSHNSGLECISQLSDLGQVTDLVSLLIFLFIISSHKGRPWLLTG